MSPLPALLLVLALSLAMLGAPRLAPEAAAQATAAHAATAPAPLSARAATAPAPLSARAETAPAFSGASALQHVNALAGTIGSRVAGSEPQGRAQQYLLEQFQALGYQAELQPFTITHYDDRGSSVTVGGQAVTAATLQYAAGGDAEGPLVEAGLGRPEDYEDADVRGKVALVQRGDIRFSDKVDAAAQAGALAVIVYNNQPGGVNGSLVTGSAIPAVTISQADGQQLRQAARTNAVTRVQVRASTEQRTAANVVATRPGGPRTLVVGGHFDSVAAGPGANDNASGTAVVVELARVMAARPTPYTLTFIAFDAEEIGLLGSAHYVRQLSDQQRQSIAAMINLDMVGVGDATRLGGSDQLIRLGMDAGMRDGVNVGSMSDSGGSDHASFMRAGVPALFIYRSNDPNYHSPNDRAELIDAANLEIAGRIALDVIGSLEQAE